MREVRIERVPICQLEVKQGLLTPEQMERILDVDHMTRPGISGKVRG